MMPTEKHHWSRMKALIRPIVMVAVFITIIFAAIAWPTKMLKDMQDEHQEVVDDNEERCKSIGAKLKTIDAGLGAADTYMCTTPDGTIVEVPEG